MRWIRAISSTLVAWAAVASPPATVSGQEAATSIAIPVTTRDALNRLLSPSGAPLDWRLVPIQEGTSVHFFADTPGGPIQGEALPNGTLIRVVQPVPHEAVPPALLATLLAGPSADRVRIERQIWMAYEVAEDLEGGSELELFIDALTRQLVEFEKPPERPEYEVPEALEDLPPVVRRRLTEILGDHEPLRLRREIELGHVVHAAKWRGVAGVQEVKLLSNGEVFFLELPRSEPIPAHIRKLAGDRDVEAMLLTVWSAIESTGLEAPRLYLPTGRRIRPASDPADSGPPPD